MESKIEQESLIDVLSIVRKNELGKEWDGKKIWLRAIVKVTKCDNSKNYAVAENDGNNNPHIIRDFGNSAKITQIDAIYPTYYISENQKPDLRNKTDICSFLSHAGYDKNNIEMLLSNTDEEGNEKTLDQKKQDKDYVKSLVDKVSIRLQLDILNEKINTQNNG